MNFWHGATSTGGAQRGAILALASLLGVGLWELTVRLRERRQRGRTVAEARTAWARRVRYPRISWTAWSIRTALGPGCSPEEAWTAAWQRWNTARPAQIAAPRTVRRAFVFHRGAPRTAPVRRAIAFRTPPRTEPVRVVRHVRIFTFTHEPVEEPTPATQIDRPAFIRELTSDILAAAEQNEKWGPDYPALRNRTGRSLSWCEKAVRDARTAVFGTGGRTGEAAA